MKTIITFALLAIAIPSFTQSNRVYSFSVNGGVFFPSGERFSSLATGYNAGIDIETRKNYFGIFLGSKLNLVKYESIIYSDIEPEYKTMTIGEITGGLRWYWGATDKPNLNLDLGLGIYTGNYLHKIHWGVQPGFGASLPFSKRISANLNVKFNMLEIEEWETYAGVYLGLRYSLNESKKTKK